MPVHPFCCWLRCPKHTQPMRPQKGRTMKTSDIDFSRLSLRNLRAMLPSTEGKESPSEIWFRENPDKVVCADACGDGMITVYSNGFYTYTEDGGEHLSILRVDGFKRIRYDFADRSKQIVEESEYLDCSYLIGLYLNGQNQWLRNADRRSSYYHELYLDYDEDDWADGVSAQSAEEELVQREETKERTDRLRMLMTHLTDRQSQIVRFYFFDDMNVKQIAKRLHVSFQYCAKTISRSLEIMKNAANKLAIEVE